MNTSGTVTQPSAISGRGLFATRPFSSGERIAPYAGPLTSIRPTTLDASAPVYGLEVSPGVWLDGSLDDNPSRHANHSCQPNAELVWHGEAEGAWLTAAHPIEPGAEITFDYGFSLAESLFHPCRCGTPECVGRIIARPLRPALRRHLRFSRPRD
jgi:SET domain-containing protein